MAALLLLPFLLTVAGRLRAGHAAAESFQCTLGPFRCQDGGQVPLCLRCDGQPDCPDGSDEVGCRLGGIIVDIDCGPRGQRCGRGGPCLPVERLCDGRRDCPDGSDESVPGCGAPAPVPEGPPCLREEFRCLPGADCFPVSWVCDGHADCPDGRDEQGCATDSPPSTTEAAPTTPGTESTENPEKLKTDLQVILAVVALLVLVVAAAAVSVWVPPRTKRFFVSFGRSQASEQLMPKEQP